MTSIVFKTPGILELEHLLTFGTSVKLCEKPIGFFGTGLKYALAILMRTGHKVTITTGGVTYPVGVKTKVLRDTEFNFVTIGDTVSGYTTEVGKTWELWKAYRELESNTRDEDGVTYSEQTLHDDTLQTAADRTDPLTTTIRVTGDEFAQVHENRNDIFLSSSPVYSGEGLDIHPWPSNYVYYRGIRVFESEQKMRFTYNLTAPTELTEDRSLANPYSMEYRARRVWAGCSDTELLLDVFTCSDGYAEHKWDFSHLVDVFQPTIWDTLIPVALKRPANFNTSIMRIAQKEARLRGVGDVPVELSGVDKKRLQIAIDFLKTIDINTEKYPIIVLGGLSDGILGMAEGGKIYLSSRVFMMGTKMVAGTLLEEYIHLEKGLCDNTRQMQNYLFDFIISLTERLNGQPI